VQEETVIQNTKEVAEALEELEKQDSKLIFSFAPVAKAQS
jgi:hypothetical protein